MMTWFSRAAPRAAAREGVEPPSRAEEEVARAVPSAGSVRGVWGKQRAGAGGGTRRRSEGVGRTTREAARERGEGGASGAIGRRGSTGNFSDRVNYAAGKQEGGNRPRLLRPEAEDGPMDAGARRETNVLQSPAAA